MKQISKLIILLSGFTNHGLFFIVFLLLILPHALASNLVADGPKLEKLDENYKTAASKYRTVLKAKKDSVNYEMKQTEDSLIAEDDTAKRKRLVEHLRGLKGQYDQLKDNLQVINAGAKS